MKPTASKPADDATPFQKFEDSMRRILSVPKSALGAKPTRETAKPIKPTKKPKR